jgi:DEAD/DEAH box helicase domain-containing protein
MVETFLARLATSDEFAGSIVHWSTEAAAAGSTVALPSWVHPGLRHALAARGITELYTHQAQAAQAAHEGEDVVVATPTASGKSLCFHLPILSELLGHPPGSRPSALYLFPTKALAQDQVAGLRALLEGLIGEDGAGLVAATYDGDTPGAIRRSLRESGDLIVTNPHMLHAAILPHHHRWTDFFARLRYVVIDELHGYGGVFGSSVANVLRRLRRVAAHHGRSLQFLAGSATIGDPAGHFAALVESQPRLVDRSGAPQPARHHVFYNPPVVDRALGLRRRALDEARRLGRALLECGVPAILFGRSRTSVELLTRYLKEDARELGFREDEVVGYRGGYLPLLRREIEAGLRAGRIRAVAATSALELGVDIGSLGAVVMAGWPGSVAAYRQQSGRAGRRDGTAVSILVASSLPEDQFLVSHPGRVLEGRGGRPALDPDNLVIATNHLKCAAFELPFERGEAFGAFPATGEVLDALAGPGGLLLARGERYHWMDQNHPADAVSLDAAEMDTFLVLEEGTGQSLGHVDRLAALSSLHPQAIYQHQGETWQVRTLDWEGRRAEAVRVDVDYYTEAETVTEIRVLTEDESAQARAARIGRGDVHVTVQATLWKRLRFHTNENLETGPIRLPAEEMDSTALWIVPEPALVRAAGLQDGRGAGAMAALARLLRGVAPIFVGIGGRDLGAHGFGLHPHWRSPAVLLHDWVPGGVGLAEGLFQRRNELVDVAARILRDCPCDRGCPSCIGVQGSPGQLRKRAVATVLQGCVDVEAGAGPLVAAWNA